MVSRKWRKKKEKREITYSVDLLQVEETAGSQGLLSLSLEVSNLIFKYLGARELLALSQLNRVYKQFCKSSALYNQCWWELYVNEWFEEEEKPTKMDHKRNWKQVYLRVGPRTQEGLKQGREPSNRHNHEYWLEQNRVPTKLEQREYYKSIRSKPKGKKPVHELSWKYNWE